jgi:hypothetical protein
MRVEDLHKTRSICGVLVTEHYSNALDPLEVIPPLCVTSDFLKHFTLFL